MNHVGGAVGGRIGGSQPFRFVLGVVAAALLAVGVPAAASAQGEACDRARIVDATSNVDLVVRCPDGSIRLIRVAGLQPWPRGYPLADPFFNRITLADRVAQAAGGSALIVSPIPGRVLPGGIEVAEVDLPGGRGSLAEIIVRQGWAQVAPDIDRVVPSLAPALRDAEDEARAARLGLWSIRNEMVTYTAPNGRSIEVDRRLVAALGLLAGLPQGQPLLNSLADAGVPLFLFAEAPEIEAWAHYEPRGRVIWVHSTLSGADPRTVATVIAHEAVHAQDHFEGRLTDRRVRSAAEAQACYDTEIRAFSTALGIWTHFFGEGRTPELHRVERESNILLSDYGATAEALQDYVTRVYRGQCRIRV